MVVSKLSRHSERGKPSDKYDKGARGTHGEGMHTPCFYNYLSDFDAKVQA